MLPKIQGFELCRILKSNPKAEVLPIIMLTVKGEEIDRVIGLEMGADGYMTKPFSPRELVARIKAVLRRFREKPAEDKEFGVGDLLINPETYSVSSVSWHANRHQNKGMTSDAAPAKKQQMVRL